MIRKSKYYFKRSPCGVKVRFELPINPFHIWGRGPTISVASTVIDAGWLFDEYVLLPDKIILRINTIITMQRLRLFRILHLDNYFIMMF